MLEVVLHGQGGRGEDPAARRALALVVEDRRDRQRRLVQLQRGRERLDPQHRFVAFDHLALARSGGPVALPAFQRLRHFHRAHAALLDRLGARGLVLEHADHRLQLLLEVGQRREEIRTRGDLRQRHAHDVLREGQAQVARGLFDGGDDFRPVGAAARVRQALGQHVAAQLEDLRGRHGLAEEQGGGVGQLVRFVEDDGVGRRQQLGHAGVLQRDVGEEQVVVDHHDVGLLRFAARLHDETVLVVLALGAHAGVARRRHQVPDRGVLGHLRQLGLVARTGHLDEARNLAQVADVIARGHAAVLHGALEVVMADVVGAALEQRHRDRGAQRRPHGRNVAQEQLVLQVLGAGRDDGLAAPQQRRHQVGEGLAGAGAGLGDQGRLVGDGLGDRFGHLGLRAARAEAADGGRERAAGTEQAVDLGVEFADRRKAPVGGVGAVAWRLDGIGQSGMSVKRRRIRPEHPAPIAFSVR